MEITGREQSREDRQLGAEERRVEMKGEESGDEEQRERAVGTSLDMGEKLMSFLT
jgi:hypothetical protein